MRARTGRGSSRATASPLPGPCGFWGFDNYANVIQAALDGQGVAIGFGGILDDLFRKGTLVRALDKPLSRGLGVHAVTRSGTRLKGPARLFHEWVVEEAKTHSGL